MLLVFGVVDAQETARGQSSYAPVDIKEDFTAIMARMKAAKAEVMKRQMDLLTERYDLSNRPAADGTTMSRGKPVQEGVRVKLPAGVTWTQLAAMTPADIRDKGLFPKGFLPCRILITPKAVWCSPASISPRSNGRKSVISPASISILICLTIPPRVPAPHLFHDAARLGRRVAGKLVTIVNYYELFNGTLNPKQLEGLRLLVTPFPQQQFNQTEDRRTERPSRGVIVLNAMSMAIPMPRPIWSGISGPRSFAIASTPPPCVASTFNGCSALSAP